MKEKKEFEIHDIQIKSIYICVFQHQVLLLKGQQLTPV